MGKLKDKVVFMTGGSRGIGRAIALRFAQDGARIALAAKTSDPHPKLEGTIHSVAREIEAAGGQALPLQVDVRDEDALRNAVEETVEEFGGLDILVNNASAISPTGLLGTPASRFDLLQTINLRGTYLCGQFAMPHLVKAENPHILTLSPPISTQGTWYGRYLAYAISKYGMTMCTLGFAEEFREQGVAANSLWPRTMISTDAVRVYYPEDYATGRKPDIMADAAYAIVTKDSRKFSGNAVIDEDFLRQEGVTDFTHYAMDPSAELALDILID
ncbi:NAD(P)-dependent oxidoreductase [Cognatishimia sp. D5M38]|jgi:citronellol/citronellal dehydrogenase|uniref:NAD(P)-dependent oxidoreductase n=1 Tax=Cognatishimia coralii TaxID=3083254 RepID=A0ABU8QK41_9RHOB|nr:MULTISPECIES: NAD(P)-dependent oxidoreductase [Roseobacteraceae]MCI5038160.1 NAD(P)-dependent oxidoreductase [Donghicola eburneus]MDD9722810.1 NAD(P)-dependent oxidoreductase [Sulfitobacter sp. PR48]